jgi:hypothetical protein
VTIIADQLDTAELPPATAKTIAGIQTRIDGFASIAQFLRTNSDLPGTPNLAATSGVLVSLTDQPDPRAAVAQWMNRAIDAGALVEPDLGDMFAGVNLYFGPVCVRAYAKAELMGELVEVKQTQWRLGIEIPEHARRVEQPPVGA